MNLIKITLKYFFWTILFLFLVSCQKELSITKFEDEYDDYDGELRIEAILNTSDISKSIVRVDSTMLVTDTTVFNEKDDDMDGETDEPDEVVPQVHASDMNVNLYNSQGEKIIRFKWDSEAKEAVYGEYNNKEFMYGGYVPDPDSIYIDTVDYNEEYEFRITGNGDTISGSFTPAAPAELYPPDSSGITEKGDTIVYEKNAPRKIKWKAGRDQRVCIISLSDIGKNGEKNRLNTYYSTRAVEDQDSSSIWRGEFAFNSRLPTGIYEFEIGIPSKKYGHYFYSDLPIKDKELNSYRDKDGNVVMGIAGSVAIDTRYIKIE